MLCLSHNQLKILNKNSTRFKCLDKNYISDFIRYPSKHRKSGSGGRVKFAEGAAGGDVEYAVSN